MDTPLIPHTDMPKTNWLLRAWSARPWGGTAATPGAEATTDASPVAISSDVVFHVAEFVGDNEFLFFALVSKHWRTAWGRRQTLTSWATPHSTVSQLRYSIDCGLKETKGWRSGLLFASLARSGNLQLLKLAHKSGCFLDPDTCAVAAGCGHLEVLQWATEQLGVWRSCTACSAAAKGGHVDVLQWAIDIGYDWCDTKTCSAAAEGGHLDLLQWLRQKGCPWDEGTCTSAAMRGHLTVLTWARTHGCPWNARICTAAAKGSPHILRWAIENGCPWDEETCIELAKVGDLATMRWARARGCPWGQKVFTAAAQGGHVHVLQYARDAGCPGIALGRSNRVNFWGPDFQQQLCYDAAAGGHLEALQWARANGYGCEWCGGECTAAAKGGHLEVLRWARENGCPWDHHTIRVAAEGGHAEVLRWARENGCPLPPDPPEPGCCHCLEVWKYYAVGRCLGELCLCLYCSCYYLPAEWCGMLKERVSSYFGSRRDFRRRGNGTRSMC